MQQHSYTSFSLGGEQHLKWNVDFDVIIVDMPIQMEWYHAWHTSHATQSIWAPEAEQLPIIRHVFSICSHFDTPR